MIQALLGDRTSHTHKSKYRGLHLNAKNHNTVRGSEPCHSLPKEVLETPAVEIFKT